MNLEVNYPLQEALDWREHGPYYDYVLTFRAPPRPGVPGGRGFKLVERVADWRLYRNEHPKADPPDGWTNLPNR